MIEHDFSDELRGPEPRSRFLAIYLIALVAVGCGLIWWGW